MTVQEAINIITTLVPKTCKMVDGRLKGGFDDWDSDAGKALKTAIKAIEKQIPKKPINKELKKYSGGTQVLFADCPMCEQPVKIYNGHQNNKEFRRDEDVYCNHCGQALDWSDENERD